MASAFCDWETVCLSTASSHMFWYRKGEWIVSSRREFDLFTCTPNCYGSVHALVSFGSTVVSGVLNMDHDWMAITQFIYSECTIYAPYASRIALATRRMSDSTRQAKANAQGVTSMKESRCGRAITRMKRPQKMSTGVSKRLTAQALHMFLVLLVGPERVEVSEELIANERQPSLILLKSLTANVTMT